VEVSHKDPQQRQQPKGQQRVLNPQVAVRVGRHANIRSHERVFGCKNFYHWWRHRRVTIAATALGLVVLVLTSGCLANPQRDQSRDLLDQLTLARGMLTEAATPLDDACSKVGDVETRLYGEPGLVDVQPAWSQLADAAHALQAVCGQSALLAQPTLDTAAAADARSRWQQGIQRELGLACDHLRAAASSLQRATRC